MADTLTTNDAKPVAAPAPAKAPEKAPEPAKAKAPAQEEGEAYYETTGEFQMFDVITNKMIPHDGKEKFNVNSPFIINGLKNKKLKKVG